MSPVNSQDFALRLENVEKIYYPRYTGIRSILRHGIWGESKSARHDAIWALNNVNLSIPRGEILGIVGANGAGKSTLLRIIAGLTFPTRGKIHVNGRLSAMLTLAAGLYPELTGRKNIYTMGMYYGRSRQQVEQRMDEIIEFAALGEFIDHPFRTYSSGMQARLAFSIVTGFGFNEILLIDEALGAGDARFAAKSASRMRELIRQGRTVLLVSHNNAAIASLCCRAVWLDHGKVVMDGDAAQVARAYSEHSAKRQQQRFDTSLPRVKNQRGHAGFSIERVELLDRNDNLCAAFQLSEPMRIRIHYRSSARLNEVEFRLSLRRADGARMLEASAQQSRLRLEDRGMVDALIDQIRFAQGAYILDVSAWSATGEMLALFQTSFQVNDPHYAERGGIPLFFPPVNWEWIRTPPNGET